MGASCSLVVQASLSGAWTALTVDTNAIDGLRIAYGIPGNGPLDCVAGTGECSVVLQNWATAGGRLQGAYSPLHANVTSGWTFGVPLRVVFTDSADSAAAVTSITRASTTATVTTTAALPANFTTNAWVTIAGANEADYNGVYQITVTGASTFTYTVANSPATPATGTITATKAHVKHRGNAHVIDPSAGAYRDQRVQVVSYDGMRDLAESDVRSIAIQTGKTETELVTVILDAVPTERQPVARDLDTGVDTFDYAFHDLGGGVKALGVIKDVAVDSYALVAMKGDGTLILRNRHARVAGTSNYTFTNTMHGFAGPSDLSQAYNLVRVTIHPPTIDAAATTVLYADQSVRSITAGATSEFWVSYRDPDESKTLIGGLNIVDPLVANTDYAGNSQADGLGSDLTGSLSVTITPFGSAALLSITNNHATATIYLVNGSGAAFLQVRGKGVYDLGPQTYEASSTQTYGVRELPIGLRYQDDAAIAQSMATFIEAQRNTLTNQPQMIEFLANDSAAFMTQALTREPGDLITVTETMTGFASVDAVIQSVELDVSPGPWVRCRWGLAPASPFVMWQIGVAGASEIGVTTTVGF